MATAEIFSCFWKELSFNSLDVYASGYTHFWKARVWHTSALLCENENGMCTPAELQAVAKKFCYTIIAKKNKAGKECITRRPRLQCYSYDECQIMKLSEFEMATLQ